MIIEDAVVGNQETGTETKDKRKLKWGKLELSQETKNLTVVNFFVQ